MSYFNLDMWYNDDKADIDKIDIYFSDCDCVYRGNVYKAGKPIGDYTTNDSCLIEPNFPHLAINWD